MEKVFVLSLHRTGTRSTTMLLRGLGYRAVHWPFSASEVPVDATIAGHEDDLDFVWNVVRPMVDKFDAFSDTPFPVLYPQLHAAYPEARFVLLHRSPRNWLRSVRQHIGNREFEPAERVQYWHYLKDKPAGLADIPVHRLIAMQARHMVEVIDFFDARDASKLAVIGLDEEGPGERLQMFLGYPGLFPLPKVGGSDEGRSGQIYQNRLKQSRASLELAAFAVGRAPGNPAFHRHHGRLLEQAGRTDEAKAELAKADELEATLRERSASAKARAEADGKQPAQPQAQARRRKAPAA